MDVRVAQHPLAQNCHCTGEEPKTKVLAALGYWSHWFSETNTLYRNEGGRRRPAGAAAVTLVRFTDITAMAGLAAPTVGLLGWGTRFFDYDHDGLLDLFVANGHVYPRIDSSG